MSFIKRFQDKWKIKNQSTVWLILLAFALTGTSVLFIKRLMPAEWRAYEYFNLIYYIGILPAYQVILLFYGLLLGQFKFLWAYEKSFFRRIIGKKSVKK